MDIFIGIYQGFSKLGIYVIPIVLVMIFTFTIRALVIEKLWNIPEKYHSILTMGVAIILSFLIMLLYYFVLKALNESIIFKVSIFILNVLICSAAGGWSKSIISSAMKIIKKREGIE